MEEKKLTEKESLELIASMIARTKSRYLGSGNMLMWGYLVVITTILVWIMLATTHNPVWNWLWLAIPIIGFPTSTIKAQRENRYRGAISYSDKVTSRLWTIFGMSQIVLFLMCLGYSFIGGINCWSALLVYPVLLSSGAEIAQGLIVKENSLIYGGAFGLVLGMITMCCIVGDVQFGINWYMPLFILAPLAMMIVPGHILSHKENRQ